MSQFRATEFGGLHGRQLLEAYRNARAAPPRNNSDTGIPLALALVAAVLALWLGGII